MQKLFEGVALSLFSLQLLGCESAQNTELISPAPALAPASEWLISLQTDLYQDELVGSAVDEYTQSSTAELHPFDAGAILATASCYSHREIKPPGSPGTLYPPPDYVIRYENADGEVVLELEVGNEGRWVSFHHVPSGHRRRYHDFEQLGPLLIELIPAGMEASRNSVADRSAERNDD